ncbi:MAG: hypothetical protein SX243_07560 [Acidobacteriota bacterium]|nr:hypothetical protein [Acidobacteriota bacterium]
MMRHSLTQPRRFRWRPSARRALCYLWASPNTLLGLLLALLALPGGGRIRWVEGAVEAHGPLLARALWLCTGLAGGAGAMTVGHVILGRTAHSLAYHRPHEHVHVRQYERWGPLFLPAYFGSSLLAYLRGQDPYRDNVFEREAYGRQ